MLIVVGVLCTIFMVFVIILKCFSADRKLRNRHRILLGIYAFGTWLVLSESRPEKSTDISVLTWGFLIFNMIAFLLFVFGEWDNLVRE
jgi:hypothetical protein